MEIELVGSMLSLELLLHPHSPALVCNKIFSFPCYFHFVTGHGRVFQKKKKTKGFQNKLVMVVALGHYNNDLQNHIPFKFIKMSCKFNSQQCFYKHHKLELTPYETKTEYLFQRNNNPMSQISWSQSLRLSSPRSEVVRERETSSSSFFACMLCCCLRLLDIRVS